MRPLQAAVGNLIADLLAAAARVEQLLVAPCVHAGSILIAASFMGSPTVTCGQLGWPVDRAA